MKKKPMPKTYLYAFFLTLLISFLWACERRFVDKRAYVDVQINFDWGGVGSKPDHLKMFFFPTDGSQPFSLFVNSEGDIINILEGEYHSLLYNWRTDNEGQSFIIKNSGSYDSYVAVTDSMVGNIFDGFVFLQPDSLFSWSSGDYILSITERSASLNTITTYAASEKPTLNIKPEFLLDAYDFFIPLKGINYLKAIHAKISGVAESINLYNKEVSGVETNMTVSLRKADGGINCHISTFGFIPEKKHIMTLRFSLCDGSIWDQEFDLTDEIKAGKVNDFRTPIEIPATECEKETQGGTFTDPGIGKWKEVSGNLNM